MYLSYIKCVHRLCHMHLSCIKCVHRLCHMYLSICIFPVSSVYIAFVICIFPISNVYIAFVICIFPISSVYIAFVICIFPVSSVYIAFVIFMYLFCVLKLQAWIWLIATHSRGWYFLICTASTQPSFIIDSSICALKQLLSGAEAYQAVTWNDGDVATLTNSTPLIANDAGVDLWADGVADIDEPPHRMSVLRQLVISSRGFRIRGDAFISHVPLICKGAFITVHVITR